MCKLIRILEKRKKFLMCMLLVYLKYTTNFVIYTDNTHVLVLF
jgi:hypothetical protein